MNQFIYIILFNTIFSIGFDGFYIPSNPTELSLSSTGVASRNNVFLSSLKSVKHSQIIGFSVNKWIQGLDGNSIYFRKKHYQFLFSSIGTNEIELRDDVPSNEPLNTIGAHLLSLEISRSFSLSDHFSIGLGSKINYHQLFIDKVTIYTAHIGSRLSINKKINLAQTINNISTDNNMPTLYTVGVSYYESKTKTELLLDYKYSNKYKSGFHLALSQNIGVLSINCGYSKYADSKVTLSGGFDFKIANYARFLYSILSFQKSNLGIAHSFGIEYSF